MEARADVKRLAVNLGISLGAIVLFLVVLELVLRVGSGDSLVREPQHHGAYDGIYRESSDPVLEVELVPGKNGTVNEAGYLGPVYSHEREPNTFRIVGLGDSVTMYGAVEGYNYLTRLGPLLRDAGIEAEVLNFGVGGYDTRQEVRQLELRGLDYRPDLVTVGYCLNDGFDERFLFNDLTDRALIAEPARDTAEAELAAARRSARDGEAEGLALVRFFRRWIRTAEADMAEDELFEHVFASNPYQDSLAALGELARHAEERGFHVVLVIFPFLIEYDDYFFAPMHDALRREAQDLGIGVIDLLPAYARHGHEAFRQEPTSTDYVHPNSRGHQIAAEAIVRYVKEHDLHRTAPSEDAGDLGP